MKSYLSQVSEFNTAFKYRQPEPIAPDLLDTVTNKLRPELIREELRELKVAFDNANRLEQLDALCDIQYVLSGAVIAWGFRPLFESKIHTISFRKIHDVTGHIAAMLGVNERMEVAAENGFQHQLFTMLVILQEALNRMVWHLGFSDVFKEAFSEVHANNMRKLWDTPDYKAEGVYQMESTIGGKWIARRGDGKILKPTTFSKVDLSRFV